ncbi:hypothetical protein BLNAU_4891 [Blattamonas nauphoetae]|uniref:Uncharacterized protein n=1 Tax=Blattamonas nauphoetae TaxID=2049346 RepID=A0ABQ9Y8J7_9EUKA|nr:hypothetical protein BLNAU_4891 [Blattamonas nauphoetae]
MKSKLSFEDKSRIYCSLVALVKAEYAFDNALQDKAAQFLQSLELKWDEKEKAAKLVTDLVPSSAGSPSDFVDSILTLLSSPHSKVTKAALSFLSATIDASPDEIRSHLVKSDLISNLLATVQPHTLPITGNEEIFDKLNWVIIECLNLADHFSLSQLDITDAVGKYNHCEMIFQKVVIPSSGFVTFLISNRYILNGDLLDSFMTLLAILIDMSPFHRPTLEFVLASPIAMAFTSCLLLFEDEHRFWVTLLNIPLSLRDWKKQSREVAQSGKRMIQALFSEGFEDALEQKMMYDKNGYCGLHLGDMFLSISHKLGSNVDCTDDDDEEDSESDDASLE